ncbi:MAG TPA: endonuclease [Erythrobacter sp.]|uniref:endonuclease/exonuclease/phosphatase family protein n=2 Tax=Erythrobacteraceae TaxID=335929 RepID=UPI000C3AD671|nr:endonuclease/exonuclease/phosphatase family protein [Qipengyuania citrea]MAQ28690.1 endonuclease [Erythrobacter sp.]MCZ4264293.1 endonuclease/exonuclease/phosphatase family protein [Erythrobacter sp. G21629-S1]MCD1589500.1 endonuclease/exonuclease/phosphatase family protein [Qipengyuania citrea]HCI61199.1 endonuclease [Erythrobacter sp.]HCJ21011.1 endonuclease [Erythrobacter sp.]
MQLTFASYNIHKAVGLDRKRDPERILSVLHEIDADIVALQEADRRIGERASVLPRAEIDDTHWRVIEVAKRPRSIGWHGNALLVRRDLEILSGEALDLPTLEPRGAACGEIVVEGRPLRVIGTHLDLSGLRRRDQIRSLLAFVGACNRDLPTVIMGDFNQWGRTTGAMREFSPDWQIVTPGRSYPSRQPVATLDRIVASKHWRLVETEVHHTGLAAVASDHLPVIAKLELLK